MPKNQLAINEQKEADFEIWKVIFSKLPYREKVLLRNLSKTFIDFFKELAGVPFLSTAIIHRALNEIVTPMQVGLSDRSESFLVRIEPLADSMDSVLIRFEPSISSLDENGNVINNDLTTPLHVSTVLTYSMQKCVHQRINDLTQQYNTLTTRQARDKYIQAYLSLPNNPEMPRWKFLNSQSEASLTRILDSLSRYNGEKFEAMKLEVNNAIASRVPDDLMKTLHI